MFVFDIFKREDRRLRVDRQHHGRRACSCCWRGCGLCKLFAPAVSSTIRKAILETSGHSRHSRKNSGPQRQRAGGQPAPLQRRSFTWRICRASLTRPTSRLSKAYGRQHPQVVHANGTRQLDGRQRAGACNWRRIARSSATSPYSVGAHLAGAAAFSTRTPSSAITPIIPTCRFEIVPDLTPEQVASFAEQLSGQPDLELETQPVRSYPNGSARRPSAGLSCSADDLDAEQISFTLPDYEGRDRRGTCI